MYSLNSKYILCKLKNISVTGPLKSTFYGSIIKYGCISVVFFTFGFVISYPPNKVTLLTYSASEYYGAISIAIKLYITYE